jgi:Mg-chelatase subunit ChlD
MIANHRPRPARQGHSSRRPGPRRKGVITVLAALTLILIFAFVAFAVDTGRIVLTQTNLQNACDAAALAASQELSMALEANMEGEDGVEEALEAAREVAREVAEANGVYIDEEVDVRFGKRWFDEENGEWPIEWDVVPYNVVRVTARRDQEDTSAADGRLPMAFGWAVGVDSVELSNSATAFFESRDIVVVMDYSASMGYDSQFRDASVERLGQPAIETNLNEIWQDLGSPAYGTMPFTPTWVTIPGQAASGTIPHIDVTWKSTAIDVVSTMSLKNVVLQYSSGHKQTFSSLSGTTGTFAGTGSHAGKQIVKCWIKSGTNSSPDGADYGEKFDFYDNSKIKAGLGLTGVSYPFASGSWNNFIDFCRDSTGDATYYTQDVADAGYRRKFGTMLFMEFLLRHKEKNSETGSLWQTRHYPFQAVKDGMTLFTEHLATLSLDDNLGLVTYDTVSRIETTEPSAGVDLSDEPMTNDYAAINSIQVHRQAGHYLSTTNIGGGLDKAIELLEEHQRAGARPTILLMTDGNANVRDPDYELPEDWDWDAITDFDGDGAADFETDDVYKQYAFGKAMEAVAMGATIHTISVGADADRDLMEAIAFAGGGEWIDVPGGSTVAAMEEQMNEAFSRIAAKVPPPKLIYEQLDEEDEE